MVFRLREEQLAAEPGYVLDVLPDGRLREDGKLLPGKLTAAQLQALIRFADRDCRLFDFDAKAVARALGKPQPGCGVGSTTTVISLTLRGKEKTARVPELLMNADQLPKNAMLQNVLALDRRLRLEARLARYGGRAMVERWLAAANARLKQRFAKEKPFTLADFEEVREIPPQGEAVYPEGWDPNDAKLRGRCARFVRREGTPQRILSAFVTTDKALLASVNRQE